MSDAQHTGSDSGKTIPSSSLIWMIIVLLVVYPLSLGPVAKVYRDKRPVPKIIEVLYWPLEQLYQNSDAAKRIILWYEEDVWGAK